MSGFVTAAWIAAGALSQSAYESNRARSDQKKARKVQQKSDKLKTQRGAIEQVRAQQIAAAEIAQGAENRGIEGSSLAQGALGAVSSQAGGNIAFAQQLFSMQQARNRLLESAYGHQGKAANLQAVASIASSASGAIGKSS